MILVYIDTLLTRNVGRLVEALLQRRTLKRRIASAQNTFNHKAEMINATVRDCASLWSEIQPLL